MSYLDVGHIFQVKIIYFETTIKVYFFSDIRGFFYLSGWIFLKHSAFEHEHTRKNQNKQYNVCYFPQSLKSF